MTNKSKGNGAVNIKDRVTAIVVKVLDPDLDAKNISEETKFVQDLGADSLNMVEMVMAVEEEFGIEVPDDEASSMRAIGDVVKYIKDKKSLDE